MWMSSTMQMGKLCSPHTASTRKDASRDVKRFSGLFNAIRMVFPPLAASDARRCALRINSKLYPECGRLTSELAFRIDQLIKTEIYLTTYSLPNCTKHFENYIQQNYDYEVLCEWIVDCIYTGDDGWIQHANNAQQHCVSWRSHPILSTSGHNLYETPYRPDVDCKRAPNRKHLKSNVIW